MNRALAAYAHVVLALSVGFFVLSIYRFGDSNWRPVEGPFPGAGFAVAASFKITNASRYRLELIVPVKIDKGEVGMSEQPPIPCNVLLSLQGPDGFHTEQAISQLRHAGRYYFGKTDTYAAEPLDLVATGEYQVNLSNMTAPGVLEERGAMFQFTRFEHSTESSLASTLVRGAGWFFLVAGLILAIASWKQSVQPLLPYAPPYLVGLATFAWYDSMVFGPDRNAVAILGIVACFVLSLLMRRYGAKFWLCIPALILAAWEYLVIAVMVLWWSIVGFAP